MENQRHANAFQWIENGKHLPYLKKASENIRAKASKYARDRASRDYKFRVLRNLRRRLYSAIKGKSVKSSKTREMIGCSVENLIKHIESLWSEGMNWGNYGAWHIDHIRPCASYDMTIPEQQRACFNWRNLQPLWAKENMAKKDSVDWNLLWEKFL